MEMVLYILHEEEVRWMNTVRGTNPNLIDAGTYLITLNRNPPHRKPPVPVPVLEQANHQSLVLEPVGEGE